MIELGLPLRGEWFTEKESEFAQEKPKKWPSYECIAKEVDREGRYWDPPESSAELLYAAAYSPLSAASHADPHCIVWSAGQTGSEDTAGFRCMSEQWEAVMRMAVVFSTQAFVQLLIIASDGMKCDCSNELTKASEQIKQASQEAKSRRDHVPTD